MSIKQHKIYHGFTVVELLIVIVVIAILASLVALGYNDVQNKARENSLNSDLVAAAKQVELAQSNGTYPSSLPGDVKASDGNVLQLTTTPGSDEFCINGYSQHGLRMSYSSVYGAKDFLCDGAGSGSTVGGVVPQTPRNVNLAPPFSEWTLTGGVSYHAETKELRLSSSTGSARSPLVRVDSPTYCRLQLESYSTQPRSGQTSKSGVHAGSQYIGADGVTLVQNSANYTSNGNAQLTDLNTWAPYSWSTACGPNVIYIRFTLNSSPTSYTSDNRLRNPIITVTGG